MSLAPLTPCAHTLGPSRNNTSDLPQKPPKCAKTAANMQHNCATLRPKLWQHCDKIATQLRQNRSRIAAKLWQHCSNIAAKLAAKLRVTKRLRQNCGNIAAATLLQQSCGKAAAKRLRQTAAKLRQNCGKIASQLQHNCGKTACGAAKLRVTKQLRQNCGKTACGKTACGKTACDQTIAAKLRQNCGNIAATLWQNCGNIAAKSLKQNMFKPKTTEIRDACFYCFGKVPTHTSTDRSHISRESRVPEPRACWTAQKMETTCSKNTTNQIRVRQSLCAPLLNSIPGLSGQPNLP